MKSVKNKAVPLKEKMFNVLMSFLSILLVATWSLYFFYVGRLNPGPAEGFYTTELLIGGLLLFMAALVIARIISQQKSIQTDSVFLFGISREDLLKALEEGNIRGKGKVYAKSFSSQKECWKYIESFECSEETPYIWIIHNTRQEEGG